MPWPSVTRWRLGLEQPPGGTQCDPPRDTGGAIAAKDERLELIERRLRETREWLDVTETPGVAAAWRGELYQSANRFAYLRWFRAVLHPEVPAWLLNVYLVKDETFKRTLRSELDDALPRAEAELGLTHTVPHSARAFLDGRLREELVDATGG